MRERYGRAALDAEHELKVQRRTDGSFTTGAATPLPSTWILMLSGFAGLVFVGFRGTRKNAAAIAAA